MAVFPSPGPELNHAASAPATDKLVGSGDRESLLASAFARRPPRAAAPVQGQLCEESASRGPAKPAGAAKQPQENGAAASSHGAGAKRKGQSAAAPVKQKPKHSKKAPTAGGTVRADVAERESEQRERARQFADNAGPIDQRQVAEGKARLAALLPPDWQNSAVSEKPEYNVYMERKTDGSERVWEYQDTNAKASLAHLSVGVAALQPYPPGPDDHERGSLRQALSRTQFALWAGIDPRPGLGFRVIAREVIPAGSFVFEYAGRYLTPEESQHNYKQCNDVRFADQLQRHRYVFSVHKEWALEWDADRMRWVTTLDTIDAESVGNISRLMNHSCEPSLEPLEVIQLRGYFRILFVAARHIYPGDELTIDYVPNYEKNKDNLGALKRCLCNSQSCRGFTC